MKLIEGHAHLTVRDDVNTYVRIFKNIKEYFDFEHFDFLSVPIHGNSTDLSSNIKTLYLKYCLSSYASAGLIHCFDERDSRKSFGDQAKLYFDMGFDGFKMLEGKPEFRKNIGKPLDDKMYWDFYEFAEAKGIPIVLHASDPEEFWNCEKITPYQKEKGWFYDSTFPSKSQIEKEVWGIMENFPKLKLTFAHMGFLTYDKKTAKEFLDKWENTAFDLTPNGTAFVHMSTELDWWKDFFKNYSKRIHFGSDLYPFESEEYTKEQLFARTWLVKKFLENDRNELTVDKDIISNGLGLSEEILSDIYYENHIRRYGKIRELNIPLIVSECDRIINSNDNRLIDDDILNLENIKAFFLLKNNK